MLFGDLASRDKSSTYSRYYERFERNAVAYSGKHCFAETGGSRAVAVGHG
jgi:hypothetical protein